MNRRVVVTGRGITTALGNGKEANLVRLIAGKPGIADISAFAVNNYRCHQGGEAREFENTDMAKIANRHWDRSTQLLLPTVREAIAEASAQTLIREMPVYLSLGTTLGGMLSGEKFFEEYLETSGKSFRVSMLTDYLAHFQALNIFRELQLKGDFNIISNACASGSNAIGDAFNAIRHGLFDMAICGGYDTMSEFTFAGFNSLMALTPGLCRPFDRHRDGLVLGEGAGIVVLEEYERALRRGAFIAGEVLGYAESSDAYHMTSPENFGTGAAMAIVKALIDAGSPEINYINAHGTATPLNDVMECRAIITALGDAGKKIPVSSIKPMTGHTLGAAGAIEAIVSLFAIETGMLIPNCNYMTPDPDCPLNVVQKPGEERSIRTVLSNSFGFGGSNAALILGDLR